MIITRTALPRRTFLRGAGAALALPLLDAMVPALTALGRTAAAPPVRLGFVFVPNGLILREFLPQTAGRGFDLPRILAPLAPWRDHLTIVSGLANAAGDALDASSGPHSRGSGCWLSGMRARRTEGADIEAGKTIDQYAADVLGRETPLASLQLALEPNFMTGNCEGGYSCAYINTLSWRTATLPLPMETNPRVVFERLFGEPGDAAARRLQRRIDRSILDGVSEDLARLQASLAPADRRTVGEYLDAVRDVEHRIQQTEQRALDAPEIEQDAPLGIPPVFEDHARLMFDLLLLAYRTDVTRVATFQIARELSHRAYTELGVPEAHHDISHHGNRAEADGEEHAHQRVPHGSVRAPRRADARDPRRRRVAARQRRPAVRRGVRRRQPARAAQPAGRAARRRRPAACNRDATSMATFDTPFMNLGLSLLDTVGAGRDVEQIGDSTGRLADV